MRRICSLVWKLIMRIQTMGNMKKTRTSAIRTPRTTRSSVD